MYKTILLLFFSVLVCWGAEPQASPSSRQKNAPASPVRTQPVDFNSDSIRISFFIIPPHIFLDENDKVSGAIYDLLEHFIAPEINVKFQWDTRPTAPARQFLNFKEKKNYIACFMVFVPTRREYLIYSQKPYYYAQSIIAVLRDNPLKEVKTAKDISHLVFGWYQNAYVTPFMQDPSIHFELVRSPDFLKINLKKVISHRIDGIYSPGKASSLFYLKKFGMLDKFKLIDLPEKPTQIHIGFPQHLKALADKFDQAFDRLEGQHLYLKLLSQYIDISRLEHVGEKHRSDGY